MSNQCGQGKIVFCFLNGQWKGKKKITCQSVETLRTLYGEGEIVSNRKWKVTKMFYKMSREKKIVTIKYYNICQTKSTSYVSSSKVGYAIVSSSIVGAPIKL
jgi:hypothetical protein